MDIISVIVCTYNQENTLPRALDAIISQKCEWPFEVIIGEDASTDNTRGICEEYVRKFPDIVYLMPAAPNKGVVRNYADCIRKAKGKYIMECGGDDEWCPERMQLCLDAIESHPNVNQVFTRIYYRNDNTGDITEPGHYLFPTGLIKGKDVIKGMMHQRSDQRVSYAITKRDALLEIMKEFPQFFHGKKYLAEDKLVVTLLGTKGDFYSLPDQTFYYTITNHSITRNSIKNNFLYSKNMLIMTHDLAKAVNYQGSLMDIYTHIVYNMCTQLVRKSIIKLFPFLHH